MLGSLLYFSFSHLFVLLLGIHPVSYRCHITADSGGAGPVAGEKDARFIWGSLSAYVLLRMSNRLLLGDVLGALVQEVLGERVADFSAGHGGEHIERVLEAHAGVLVDAPLQVPDGGKMSYTSMAPRAAPRGPIYARGVYIARQTKKWAHRRKTIIFIAARSKFKYSIRPRCAATALLFNSICWFPFLRAATTIEVCRRALLHCFIVRRRRPRGQMVNT